MGLCKCPKRLVTNQFCFEHRVNVCEHCMVNSHPKCIIQSYIQWLKDSDYDSSCALCKNSLESDECIRLTCYHVFHWSCLNERESALPSNTAPGGHTCPTCYDQIFPSSNLISPVADVLRSRLKKTSWGRDEFGAILKPNATFSENSKLNHASNSNSNSGVENLSIKENANTLSSSSINKSSSIHETPKDHSINIDSTAPYYQASSRRPLLSREPPIGGVDRDENKYKRRTPAEIFSRWSRRLYVPPSRPLLRRTWFIVLSGFVIFVFIIYIMASLGRRNNNDSEEEFPHM
ncbi:zinc finger protein-like 1 homolog [Contarinia nasturtii]|uniref:zinc finger protein-like 1 homolog n=1 Tax=Contarinia nasturtii TaxID=265458 RepID=UPI0012D4526F|nr:zinc finger protein-like 1 homolog [Contarinia nasturtii]